MSLYDTIKTITRGCLEAAKLADVMVATVTRAEPIEVLLEQQLRLPAEFLTVPEHLHPLDVSVGSEVVSVRTGLAAGDRVVLIRQQGGLNFLVAGRLVP